MVLFPSLGKTCLLTPRESFGNSTDVHQLIIQLAIKVKPTATLLKKILNLLQRDRESIAKFFP